MPPGARAAADRYRFASPLATRISARSATRFLPRFAGGRRQTRDARRRIILIPARMASTRLPGKPLADIARPADDRARAAPRAGGADRRGGGGDRFRGGRGRGGKGRRPRGHDAGRPRLRLRPHLSRRWRRSTPSAASRSSSMCRATCRPSIRPTSAPRSRRSPIRPSISRRSPPRSRDPHERTNPNVVKVIGHAGRAGPAARARPSPAPTPPRRRARTITTSGFTPTGARRSSASSRCRPRRNEQREQLEQLRALDAGMRIDVAHRRQRAARRRYAGGSGARRARCSPVDLTVEPSAYGHAGGVWGQRWPRRRSSSRASRGRIRISPAAKPIRTTSRCPARPSRTASPR